MTGQWNGKMTSWLNEMFKIITAWEKWIVDKMTVYYNVK